jgi:pantoate--beta-alanine ligase
MFVFKSIAQLSAHLELRKSEGQEIGFVPTMGALHQGHLSLIQQSLAHQCYTVCSIYVNPTQFNNAQDFEKYPITIEEDVKKLASAGCHVLFLPSTDEMYGADVAAIKSDYGSLTNNYEGALRPGHFDGVITIVAKLFKAVNPDKVFFGQKDLQQCMVVNRLITKQFPNIYMELVPTVREASGLAMSSRNVRLTEAQRELAVELSKAIFFVRDETLKGHNISQALATAAANIQSHKEFKLEYLDLVHMDTMEHAENIEDGERYAVVIACWCAEVRLIDNVLLTE